MPRFVVLRHTPPPSADRAAHWDVMFEQDDVLRTWAVESVPDAAAEQPAAALADHRSAYLDYEGPVSGNRGEVVRWDAGTFELLSDAADEFSVRVVGRRLYGIVRLHRDGAAWRYVYRPETAPSPNEP